MLVTMFPWFFRRPILIGSLLMFFITWFYIWIAWFATLPDWYLAYKFAMEKKKFYKLASMLIQDEAEYGSMINNGHYAECCSIYIDKSGRVNLITTGREGLTDLRLKEYESLMNEIGVVSIGPFGRGKRNVWITVSHFIGGSVQYLYSEDDPINCEEYIFDISGGMPAYRCRQLDGRWYLFHVPL
ncbi:MAG: hypothetical protein HQL57_07575 [Magnetococcales bacterium]|nr:hypothetical protein [Magnetococcales bacterium]MBF0157025.1 hypothetical protein [Magnetococcales bacterium]